MDLNMSSTSTSPSFPVEVKKTITFIAADQEDLDYLNSQKNENDFLADMATFGTEISLEILKVE
jgi:hypothetical protein